VHAAWNSLLIGFPVLLLHLALTAGLLLVGLAIYLKFLHINELEHLREGNIAAAIVFSGQLLALAIPLSAMMANSINASGIILWGCVTVILQLIALILLRLLLPGLREHLVRGDVAPAMVFASGQIVTGLLTAASLSG
jgi:putative membrane protein